MSYLLLSPQVSSSLPSSILANALLLISLVNKQQSRKNNKLLLTKLLNSFHLGYHTGFSLLLIRLNGLHSLKGVHQPLHLWTGFHSFLAFLRVSFHEFFLLTPASSDFLSLLAYSHHLTNRNSCGFFVSLLGFFFCYTQLVQARRLNATLRERGSLPSRAHQVAFWGL